MDGVGKMEIILRSEMGDISHHHSWAKNSVEVVMRRKPRFLYRPPRIKCGWCEEKCIIEESYNLTPATSITDSTTTVLALRNVICMVFKSNTILWKSTQNVVVASQMHLVSWLHQHTPVPTPMLQIASTLSPSLMEHISTYLSKPWTLFAKKNHQLMIT